VDSAHLLATEVIQELSACLAEDLVRYGLNFEAAIRVQRQKRTSIEIDIIDRPSVRGQKNGLLLEAPRNASASVDFPLPRGPIMQVSPRGMLTLKPGRNPPLISIFSTSHMVEPLPRPQLERYRHQHIESSLGAAAQPDW